MSSKNILICDTNLRLVFDNDCLASFLWIRRIDILETLYKSRMYIPQIVVDEFSYLKSYSNYSWAYNDLIDAIQKGLFTVIDIKVGDKTFEEYNRLIKLNKGKGESAAIAIAKTMDNYIACNNLRDIRPLIDCGELNNIFTLDILYEYYIKENKTIDEIEKIITDMRSKKRKLPNISFEEYVKERESLDISFD